MSRQGRLLKEHEFPCPAHAPLSFASRSRCLIDLGSCLVVKTLGTADCPPFQKNGLARLETTNRTIEFVDDSQLSKEECESLLLEVLAKLSECQIVGVEFPYYDCLTKVKYRPCVALYGEGLPALYLAAFVGAPRSASASALWEIYLGAPQELSPGDAPDSIVDVSKLCTMPSHYYLPGARDNGKESWDHFKVNHPKKRAFLAAVNPAELRQRIVDTLVMMLRQDPLLYVDSTMGLNETGLIKHFSWDEKEGLSVNLEWCDAKQGLA